MRNIRNIFLISSQIISARLQQTKGSGWLKKKKKKALSGGKRRHLEYLITPSCCSSGSRCCSQVNSTGQALIRRGNICRLPTASLHYSVTLQSSSVSHQESVYSHVLYVIQERCQYYSLQYHLTPFRSNIVLVFISSCTRFLWLCSKRKLLA